MTKVTIDSATIAKLQGLSERLEFCDEEGNLLGRFEPDENSPAFRSWLRNLELDIPEAELVRREQQQGGISTEELLQQLRAAR